MATRATLANQTGRGFRELTGVVVNAGKMDKTVTVRVGGTKWHPGLQKPFKTPKTHMVHDPNNSLRLGDVLTIVPGWRTSRHKRHIVNRMILPAGIPLNQRPPIPTEDERLAYREGRFFDKKQRKAVAKGERIDQALSDAEARLPKDIAAMRHKIEHSGIGRMMKAQGELDAKLDTEEAKMRDRVEKWRARFRSSEFWTALEAYRLKTADPEAEAAAEEEKKQAEAAAAEEERLAVAATKKKQQKAEKRARYAAATSARETATLGTRDSKSGLPSDENTPRKQDVKSEEK